MSRVADVALKAVTAKGYETKPGYCQRFVRQVVTEALGEKWGEVVRTPSAKESAYKLIQLGYAAIYKGGVIQPGDILYKTVGSGGFGHVGIAVRRNGELMVAENSSYHAARNANGDARGFRTLQQFGAFQVLARLPEPVTETQPAIPAPVARPFVALLNDEPLTGARIENKTLIAPVREVLDALGYDIVKVNDRLKERNRFDIRAEPVKA